jgi:hypothetical protein
MSYCFLYTAFYIQENLQKQTKVSGHKTIKAYRNTVMAAYHGALFAALKPCCRQQHRLAVFLRQQQFATVNNSRNICMTNYKKGP